MKNLLIIILILISLATQATTYQIANQSAFNAFDFSTLVAGDIVQFQKGQTFSGSITISDSGTSGNPITLTAYGSGANPIITGFTSVAAWTNLGGNIWESTSAVSTLATCNLVSINGVNTAMGRYPNANAGNGGYLTFQSHVAHTSITSSSLTGTPDWTGATVVVRTKNWTIDQTEIASQSTGTLNFTALPGYEPTNGYGFFIQADSRTLDYQNEWYYNPTTKKIQVYSTSQPTNVKVASVENILTINGDYVTIDGLDITGANSNLIYTASTTIDHTIIQNCTISFAGISSVRFRSDHFDILNNNISDANGSGLQIDYSKHMVVSGNTINRINQFQGMGQNGNNTHFAYGGYGQLYATIENNTISNIGGGAIDCHGDSITVKNNYIDTFSFVVNDAGGIYTFVGEGTPYNQIIIEGNIVLNGLGASSGTTESQQSYGIYLDDNSNNVAVINNTVANNDGAGIYLHNNQDVNIRGNTLYNNIKQALISHNSTGNMISGLIFKDNILVSKSANQVVIQLFTSQGTLTSFGVLDSNYYARPMNDTNVFYYKQPTMESYVYNTLAEWQSFSNQDANSTKSPNSVSSTSDIQFMYNETNTNKNVALNYPSVDMYSNKNVGIITLLPYTSKVFLKDPNPAPAPPPGTNKVGVSGGKYGLVGNRPGLM